MHMTPACYAIHVFGGVTQLAKAIGKDASRVSRWQRDRAKADGGIPPDAQRRILEIAKERNLDIKAEDLILGREVMQKV